MGNYTLNFLAALVLWSGSLLAFPLDGKAQTGEESPPPLSLSEAFGKPEPSSPPVAPDSPEEVEPVVVGRKKWTDRAAKNTQQGGAPAEDAAKSVKIDELDPLETKQPKAENIEMPLKAPVTPPAVNIHRNFEGTLVLKPRNLGFERDFPFQLENARGKRLAFVDMESLRTLDPIAFKNQKVNVLGKLEAVEKGSNELVIRARLVRRVD
ncbi:MAG: hypothetical protein HN531_01960 [Opitutae bacterium]|nr:hypothetical protein [Opitutae bacterium]